MKRIFALKSQKKVDLLMMRRWYYCGNSMNKSKSLENLCNTDVKIKKSKSKENLNTTKNVKIKKNKSSDNLYVPQVPFFCPLTKQLRDNEYVRDVLVHDNTKHVKPRLTWYNPNGEIIPTDWFIDGIYSDLQYYFNETN